MTLSRASVGRRRPNSRTLRVSYWQLTDLRTGRPFASPSGGSVDWESLLTRLTGVPNLAGDISGRVYSAAGQPRLVLARDRAFAHRQRDPQGNPSDMLVSSPGNEPIEEAFVSFIPGTNAFGFARTSTAAPPSSAVASWLMAQNMPNRQSAPRVDPIIDNDRFERARRESEARQANWVDVIARPPAEAPNRGSSSMLGQLFRVGNDVGNYKIHLRLTVDDNEPDAADLRRQLFDSAVELANEVSADDHAIEHAEVKVLGEVGAIDLIHDRIVYTARGKIEVSGTNRSLNELTVFDSMDRVFVRYGDRIRRCLGAP